MSQQDQNVDKTSEFLGEEPQVKAQDLVGEDKKFKDFDALAYGKEMADRHIQTLEQERQRDRERIAQLEAQVGAIDDLKSEIMSTREGTQAQVEPDPVSGSSEPTPQVDLTDQVRQILDQTERERVEEANLLTVRSSLVDKYGDKWADEFKRIASDNGLSNEDLVAVAQRSPSMFLKVSGLDGGTPQPTSHITPGSVNTEADLGNTGSSEVRDQTFYRKKRQEMGASYYDSHWNQQEMEDAMKHPEWFQ